MEQDYPMGSGINWSKTQRRYDDKDRQTIFDIRQPPEVQGRSYEGTTYGPYVTAGQTDSLQANVWSSNQVSPSYFKVVKAYQKSDI